MGNAEYIVSSAEVESPVPVFYGTHFLTLDEKSRIPIPAKHFEVLVERIRHEHGLGASDPLPEISVVVCMTPGGHPGVYTAKSYQQLLKDVRDPNCHEYDDLNRAFLFSYLQRTCESQTLDKQNRIRVSPALYDTALHPKEVAVVGCGNWLEIHSKENWLTTLRHQAEFLQHRQMNLQSQAQLALPYPNMMPAMVPMMPYHPGNHPAMNTGFGLEGGTNGTGYNPYPPQK